MRHLAPIMWLVAALPLASHGQTILFENGPLANVGGAGPGGTDLSVMENLALGDQSFGFNAFPDPTFDFRVADDFTVPAGEQWQIQDVVVYGYQVQAPPADPLDPPSTLTDVDLRIWNGVPGAPGSTMVSSTGGLAATSWSQVYRVAEDDLNNLARAVMAAEVAVGTSLGPGTYWLDWQLDGSIAAAVLVPPVPTTAGGVTGNGRRFDTFNDWIDLEDEATNDAKGLPFEVRGTVGGAPGPVVIPTLDPSVLLSLAVVLGCAGILLLRRTSL